MAKLIIYVSAILKLSVSKLIAVYQKPSSTVFYNCNIVIWTDLNNKPLQYYQHLVTKIESIMCLYGSGLNLVAIISLKCLKELDGKLCFRF